MSTIKNLLRYAMFSWLALSFAMAHAQSVYDKTYTWTASDVQNGATQTSKYNQKATHPAQILALLGNLYVDKAVPGFKQHIEYNTDGTLSTTQIAPSDINYDMGGRQLYYFRPATGKPYSDKNYAQRHDRISWIAKLPGYDAFTTSKHYVYNADTATTTILEAKRKDYTKVIDAPTDEGATVLFVEIKDSWKDEDIRLFIGNTNGGRGAPYSGEYFWNAHPHNNSGDNVYYWNGTQNVNGGSTSRVFQKFGSNGGTSYNYDNDYTDLFYTLDSAFVANAIESVQLVDNVFRVDDDDNPGYLCMIDHVSSKRFFYLAKGRVRCGEWMPPFYNAYEQMSPIMSNTLVTDLANGDIYGFVHDCRSVIAGKARSTDGNTANAVWTYDPHYAVNDSIDPTTGEPYAIDYLTLFIPDKRFTTHTGTDNSKKLGYAYNVSDVTNERGNTHYNPKMLIYQAELSATATPSATKGYYDIKLDWLSLFDASKIYTTVDEQFYVYAIDPETGNYIQLDTFIDSDDNYVKDAAIGTTTRSKTYTYRVKILDNSQQFTYIVTANPIDPATDGPTDIRVNTNTVTVTVPGRDQFALDGSEYRSRYNQATEENLYKNTLRVRPNAAFDNIPANSEYYEMWRKTVGTTDNVLVATISFTLHELNPRSYDYTVSYKQSVPSPCFDSSPARSTSGTLYDNVSIDLVDYFNVSTEENEQPARYSYAVLNKSETQSSDDFSVPVNKTSNQVTMDPVTLADVEGDTDHSLVHERVATVTFSGQLDDIESIEGYNLYRIDGGTTTHIGKVERQGTSADFNVMSYDPAENTWVSKGTVDLSSLETFTFTENLDELELSDPRYVPTITTIVPGLDGNEVTNTYGCDMLDPNQPRFGFNCSARDVSTRDAGEEGYKAYRASITLTPTIPAALDGVYLYRVWRVNDDGSETLLNNVTPPSVVTENDVLVTAIQGTYPGQSVLTFSDYIIHEELQDGESFTVNYIARMYAYKTVGTTTPPTDNDGPGVIVPSPAPRRAANTDQYYMSEQNGSVTFSSDIVTGIERVTNAPTVVKVIYYNMMGMAASQPWQGTNVECQVMSDGTIVTRKFRK